MILTDESVDEATWLALRDSGIKPLNSSGFRTTERDRAEFLEGARLLRIHGETAKPGTGIKPQQLCMVDALAMGLARNAHELPRRSSKTTSLVAIALGRAATRPDYRVGILTLTSGKAGRARFLKDVAPALERVATVGFGSVKRNWPYVVGRSAGQEGVTFRESGGIVSWLSSIDDLRGEAFDLIILDESQAADPEKVAEVIAAALPTLDTRPDAQIVVAGTAGKWRVGNLLWEWLEQGRAGNAGILEYAADPDTPAETMASWELVEQLLLACHPGIGTLTTMEAVKGNWLAMKPDQFAQEYCGLWGTIGEGGGILKAAKWLDAGGGAKGAQAASLLDSLEGFEPDADSTPEVPERFAMAAGTHVDQRSAAIVAAWRDERGRACGYVLDYRRNVTWLADAAAAKARQHRTGVIYDAGSGPMRTEVEAMERMTPRPILEPQTTADVAAAAALLTKEVNEGNARHWHQPALDAAAKAAVRRPIGPGRWAFGRGTDPDADIVPLELWALALRWYDEHPQRAMFAPIVAHR